MYKYECVTPYPATFIRTPYSYILMESGMFIISQLFIIMQLMFETKAGDVSRFERLACSI